FQVFPIGYVLQKFPDSLNPHLKELEYQSNCLFHNQLEMFESLFASPRHLNSFYSLKQRNNSDHARIFQQLSLDGLLTSLSFAAGASCLCNIVWTLQYKL